MMVVVNFRLYLPLLTIEGVCINKGTCLNPFRDKIFFLLLNDSL